MNDEAIREALDRAVVGISGDSRHGERIVTAARASRRRRRAGVAVSGSVVAAALVFGGLAWSDDGFMHGRERQEAAAWSPSRSDRVVTLSSVSPVPTITLQPGERFVARAKVTAGGVAPAQSSDEKVLRRVHTAMADDGSSLAEFEALTPGIATLRVSVTPLGSLNADAYALIVRVAGIQAPANAPTA